MNKPLLSICLLTYNHSLYIEQCLNGIFSQIVNFDFELLIYNDFSDDETCKIIDEYKAKHKNIIEYKTEYNRFSIGIRGLNLRYNIFRSEAKYISLIEGDDYWIDSFKLQKQIDFLEANVEYTVCFTNYYVLRDNVDKLEYGIKNLKVVDKLNSNNLFIENYIPTNNVMYRNVFKEYCIPSKILNIYPGDWLLAILAGCKGKIKFLSDFTSIYRIHSFGICSSTPSHINTIRYFKFLFKLFVFFDFKKKFIIIISLIKLCFLFGIRYIRNKW